MRATWSSALGSHWRREVLRTNLWVVPSLEVLGAAVLFACTLRAGPGRVPGRRSRLPAWVISGSADAARQILTTLAAAVITVVGVVFSIILVTLTLASTQFGPRMLRNFIRDRGTQLTLGTFVATFVYAVLVLVSIGPGPHGDFVPHIGVTVTLGLMVADLGRPHLLHPPHRRLDPAAPGDRRASPATWPTRSRRRRRRPRADGGPEAGPPLPNSWPMLESDGAACGHRPAATCSSSASTRWSRSPPTRTR